MKPILMYTFVLLLISVTSCQQTSSDALTCDDLMAVMEECSPDLAANATCTQATLDAYAGSDPESLSCESLTDPGAADLSFNGCDEGSHPCGWFCCEDYKMTWSPDPSGDDFDIVEIVHAYQDVPSEDCERQLRPEEQTYGCTYVMDVDDGRDSRDPCVPLLTLRGPQEMAVEVTHGRVDLPFEEFLRRFDPATWGINLDHYLGGELVVVERDSEGRVVKQMERMVLTALPCETETDLLNMDMTKTEVIVYEEDIVTVYWRVMYSDNCSTLADVGSVSFARHSEDETLITFHSAHLLGTPLGTVLLSSLALPTLSSFFADHVNHYRDLVTREY